MIIIRLIRYGYALLISLYAANGIKIEALFRTDVYGVKNKYPTNYLPIMPTI